MLIIARKPATVKKEYDKRGDKKLNEQAREAQRVYMREWRRKNKDKVRANNHRYWEKRAERMAAKKGEGHDDTISENLRGQ